MIYVHTLNYCDLQTRRIATVTFSIWCNLVPREVQLTTMLEI